MVRSRSDHSEPSEPSSTTANHPTSPSYTDAHPVRAAQTGETDCTPDSEDPERPDAARAPSPPGHEANAPPPDEEVTKLRLTAHYAGLVLASMIGCLIRLGLDALGDCESVESSCSCHWDRAAEAAMVDEARDHADRRGGPERHGRWCSGGADTRRWTHHLPAGLVPGRRLCYHGHVDGAEE